MDAVIVIVIIFTAAGVMMLLFSRNPEPATSSVSLPRCVCTPTTSNHPPQVESMLLASTDAADPAGELIWITQIPALRFVCDHEPQGAFCADLKPFYVDLARRYPEICDGYSFHDWGQLLLDLDVFRVEETRVHITPEGRDLLETLLAMRRWRFQDHVAVE